VLSCARDTGGAAVKAILGSTGFGEGDQNRRLALLEERVSVLTELVKSLIKRIEVLEERALPREEPVLGAVLSPSREEALTEA
jgi:hypothetical protein